MGVSRHSNASKVHRMIGRAIAYKYKDVLLWLYKSLVRPHLEYCSSVWSPYYSKDKQLVIGKQKKNRAGLL